jgi:hypothetical protein
MAEEHNGYYCAMHEENTKTLGKHSFTLGRNSGQFKILLWILGLGIGSMSTIVGMAYYSQQTAIHAIAESVQSIDKVMSSYVAGHIVESRDGFRRIGILEMKVNDLDERLDKLEIDWEGL